MLRSPRLSRHPAVFRALTGLNVAEFDALARVAVPALAEADRRRLSRPDRKRASGAGHPTALVPPDQILRTVIWRRRSPTDGVLGSLFGVDEATVRRTRGRVVPGLAGLGRAELRRPDPETAKRPTRDALLADTPGLAVSIDPVEPRVQRPQDRAVAAPDSSGKKQQHTRTTQVAVTEDDGRFADVAPGVRGPTAAITLLQDSGLLERLPPEVGGLGDLASIGIGALHPAELGATPRRNPRGQERPPEDSAVTPAVARRRVRVEHSIRRLRLDACLAQTDRPHQRGADARAGAGAGLVNRPIAARQIAARRGPATPRQTAVVALPPGGAGGPEASTAADSIAA